jgi:uncharacterized PurR-regulated membrane protein YhhQ (DUF165 family)
VGGGGIVIYSFGFILLGLDLDVREIGRRMRRIIIVIVIVIIVIIILLLFIIITNNSISIYNCNESPQNNST